MTKDKSPNTSTALVHQSSEGQDKPATAFTIISSKYSETFPLRAFVQGIPIVGSTIDTLMAGLGARWQAERLEKFLKALSEKLSQVESQQMVPSPVPTEPLYDFTCQVFDHAIRTRSDLKRERLANLVAHQVAAPVAWDEAEAALRLVGALDEVHLRIIALGGNLPICDEPFAGLKVVTIEEEKTVEGVVGPSELKKLLPGVPLHALQLAMSELVARGVFRDEGAGRFDTRSLQLFSLTELGQWLIARVAEL